MFISEDWYICEIPSLQGEIVARSMLDSDFFVVTLPPLGYFDIAFALCVWRYKGIEKFVKYPNIFGYILLVIS